MTSPAASEQAEPTPVDSQSQMAALKQEPVQAATPQGRLASADEPIIAKADSPASELPLLVALGSASLSGVLPVRFLRRRR